MNVIAGPPGDFTNITSQVTSAQFGAGPISNRTVLRVNCDPLFVTNRSNAPNGCGTLRNAPAMAGAFGHGTCITFDPVLGDHPTISVGPGVTLPHLQYGANILGNC